MVKRIGIYGYAVITDGFLSNGGQVAVREDEKLENAYLPGISLKFTSKLSVDLAIAIKSVLDGTDLRIDPNDLGIISGSALGAYVPISDFCRVSAQEGPEAVSPMSFPLTVSNQSASQAAIWFKLKGPVFTLADGTTSSLDAISLACDEIRYNGARYYMAGGNDQLPIGIEDGYASYYDHRIAAGERLMDGTGVVLLAEIQPGHESYAAEIVDYDHCKFSSGDRAGRMAEAIGRMIDSHRIASSELAIAATYRPYHAIQNRLEQIVQEDMGLSVQHWNITERGYDNYLSANGMFSLAQMLDRSDSAERPYVLIIEVSRTGNLSMVMIRRSRQQL